MKRFMKLTMALAMSLSMMVCGFGSSIEAKEKKQEETTKAEVINLYGSKKVKLGELEYGVNPDFTVGFDEDEDSLTEHTFYLNGKGKCPVLSIYDAGDASDELYENFDAECEKTFKILAEEFNLEDYTYDMEYKQIKKEKASELICNLSSNDIQKIYGTDIETEGDIELRIEIILCPNRQVYLIMFIKEAKDENKYDLDDFVKSIDFSKFETDSSKNTTSDQSSIVPDVGEFDGSSADC